MSTGRIGGVVAAIITPVNRAGEPDVPAFVELATKLLGEGCHGLNVLGTTGEAVSLGVKQRTEMMQKIGQSPLPLERMMVGTGAAAVTDAVLLTRTAAELGFAGALVLPPFYYKDVSEEGLCRYIDALVTATASAPIPIYLYNFPALSGVPYTRSLVAALKRSFGDRIVGLKDSSGDIDYAAALAARGDIDVFPSNEGTLLRARNGEFAGCISATANVNARFCARAFDSGDEIALQVATRIRALFDGKPLVSGVKSLLAQIHEQPDLARPIPPLVEWSAEDTDELFRLYRAIVAG